jgi:hypothetical protein
MCSKGSAALRIQSAGAVRSSNVNEFPHYLKRINWLICLGFATYLMLWPEDGRMMKEDIRGIYDGSIFYTLAARRAKDQ